MTHGEITVWVALIAAGSAIVGGGLAMLGQFFIERGRRTYEREEARRAERVAAYRALIEQYTAWLEAKPKLDKPSYNALWDAFLMASVFSHPKSEEALEEFSNCVQAVHLTYLDGTFNPKLDSPSAEQVALHAAWGKTRTAMREELGILKKVGQVPVAVGVSGVTLTPSSESRARMYRTWPLGMLA